MCTKFDKWHKGHGVCTFDKWHKGQCMVTYMYFINDARDNVCANGLLMACRTFYVH